MSEEIRHKRIMHLDMDTFFVSVERLLNPSLQGKPVVVGGMPFERGVVAGCSREARIYGIHSAMALRKAYQLCPQAVFMYPTGKYYGLYSERIMDILEEEAPYFEKASVDEFYIDIAGVAKVLGDEAAWCRKLKNRITEELHLPLTFGVGNGKTVAKIATNAGKKSGDIMIAPGAERAFLAPLPIRMMPGIGAVTEQTMKTLNIATIGQLADLPGRIITEVFGKVGQALQDRARGIDTSPLVPYRRQKSLGSEHTFMEDVDDVQRMIATLKHLAVRIGRDLRTKKLSAGTITLKMRDYAFKTVSRAAKVEYTNADHKIYDTAFRTFTALYEPGIPIRLIGITTSDLIEDYEQTALFDAQELRMKRLYEGLDVIRDRFGKHAIQYGGSLLVYGAESPDSGKSAA